MSDETTLLPCPWCGGEATVERIGRSGYFYVACNTAYCCDFGMFDTESEAIAAWNTRADTEYGGIPATEENMAKHGWVRERTCRAIAIYNMHDEWFCDSCSACGYEWYEDEPRFCPHCGARVKEGGDD